MLGLHSCKKVAVVETGDGGLYDDRSSDFTSQESGDECVYLSGRGNRRADVDRLRVLVRPDVDVSVNPHPAPIR